MASDGANDAPRDATQDRPAQTAAPAKPPKPYGGGSPLDVLMHTKLWVTPPEPKEFVKESREPLSTLEYQPTAKAPDPVRPKVLSSGELKSLQGELEQAGAKNEKAASVKKKNFANVAAAKSAKDKPQKPNAKTNTADAPTELHAR
jgi:hypothetical protein